MIIYKVTNTINKKVYIGKTTKLLKERKKTHYKISRTSIKTKLYCALRKYEENVFVWEEIARCNNEDDLNDLEIFFIKKFDSFKNGYNMTYGGDGGDTISMKSAEDKKKQGAKIGNVPWNKGFDMRKNGYDFYDNINHSHIFTDEEKKNISNKIKLSQKYYEGLKNRIHGMSKPVIRISDGKKWESAKKCAEEIGTTPYKVRRYIEKNILINNEQFQYVK